METKPVVWFKLELIELQGCVLPEHELVWVRRMQFILSPGKSIPCNIVVGVQHLPIQNSIFLHDYLLNILITETLPIDLSAVSVTVTV